MTEGILTRWHALLPASDLTSPLSLGEGETPLLFAPRLAEWVGVAELHLKIEGANPTGSFKDRGMVLAVAKAHAAGATAVLCASTGNTAASAAAYAARAGLRAIVLLPAGNVAAGKLAQAVMHGARVISVAGNFDRALELAREACERMPITLVNSVNPDRIAGQTTAAFEICEELGDAPDVLAIPVGNGGNITAYWRGFNTFHSLGRVAALPRIVGVQAAGAAPFVHGHPVDNPETIATAIRIGRPATWEPALAAAQESGGHMRAVTDEEIMGAYAVVARAEGVFCEPASAASLAGLRAAVKEGVIDPQTRCVCVLTGNGLKDPDSATRAGMQIEEIPADFQSLETALNK